jgi:hypothetical protein
LSNITTASPLSTATTLSNTMSASSAGLVPQRAGGRYGLADEFQMDR